MAHTCNIFIENVVLFNDIVKYLLSPSIDDQDLPLQRQSAK